MLLAYISLYYVSDSVPTLASQFYRPCTTVGQRSEFECDQTDQDLPNFELKNSKLCLSRIESYSVCTILKTTYSTIA